MDGSRYEAGAKVRTVFCPECGLEYAAGAKYCGRDGAALGGVAEPSVAVPLPGGTGASVVSKVCPLCRKSYPAYAQFCPEDARKLVAATDSQAPQSAGASQAVSKPAGKESTFSALASDLSLPEDEMMGKTIAGKYRIDALLGEGGMAQVFRATHLGIEKPVVIKLMHGSVPSMQNAVKRFEVECKVTARLNHPNLVSVFDGGVLDGKRPYLVMELIEGESLRDKIAREGPMPFATALTIMEQVCSGLGEAHAGGVVHRDLKPENIMLRDRSDRPDWVKVVDFGIAHLKHGGQKLTGTGIAVGTVDYMSPEYLSDKPIDHRADIYALGVMFFELLTGQCPFQAETPEAVMAKHLWSSPMPPSFYRGDLKPGCLIDLICEKALEKEPDKRYQHVLEMRADLQRALMNVDEMLR